MEIARMVLANRDVIRGGVGLDSKTTAIRKTELWQNIYDHLTAMGAVIPNVFHLRKVSTKFKKSPKLCDFICEVFI